MKRLVLFAAVVVLAACAKKDDMATDSGTAMAPAMSAMTDSAMMADSIRADSIRKADSGMMDMKKDSGMEKH